MESGAGELVLVAAPVRSVGDVSSRLRTALAAADVIVTGAPDHFHQFTRELDITLTGRVISNPVDSAPDRIDELIELVATGQTVAVITDGVADLGHRLVRAALARELAVQVVPGPNAVTTALAVSGLPCDRFCVEGFPPPAPRSHFQRLAHEPRTLVFFETASRIGTTLADLADAFGAERPAVLCRDLTTAGAQVRRDTLGALAQWAAATDPTGEITLVVAGGVEHKADRPTDETLLAAVADRVSDGLSRRDAIAAVATATGLPRREVYELIVNRTPTDTPTTSGHSSPGR